MVDVFEQSAQWTPAGKIVTPRGLWFVRNASATLAAIDLWRKHATALQQHGYSLGVSRDGKQYFEHWELNLNEDELLRMQALSHANDSEFNPPAPEGLFYRGYQKAGIQFAWELKSKRPSGVPLDQSRWFW